jgi:hypothetical protein
MLPMGALLAAYPCIVYKTTDSLAAAFLSPFIVFAALLPLLFSLKTDTYWALGFIVVLALPLLSIVYNREWDRKSLFIALFLSVAAGLANLPREHAGLGVALLLLATVFVKTRSAKKPLCFGGVVIFCVISYFLFTRLVPALYFTIYEQPVEIRQMGPWHTLYIGLGWEKTLYGTDNKYGIIYKDGHAAETVKKINPQCVVYSNEYMEILKKEWFRLLKDDTAWFLKNYARKFAASVLDFPLRISAMIRSRAVFVSLCAVAALCLFGFSRLLRSRFAAAKLLGQYWYLLFASVFCYFFYTIFGLAAVPWPTYLLGTMASAMAIVVFSLLFAIAILEQVFLGKPQKS